MQVKIIGAHGGQTPKHRTTSYLLGQDLLIDAGSVASGISIKDQSKIENILISHPHLDHISGLAYLCDNCFGMKDRPFEVFMNRPVLNAVKDHLFNDLIWPDFTKIPSKTKPTMRLNEVVPENRFNVGEYEVTAIRVNHDCEATGFIIRKGEKALLFTQDTGPTERIWEVAHETKGLCGIFSEISFPNSMEAVAEASRHHTPKSFMHEIKKMPIDVPLFVGHLKPGKEKELEKEISELGLGKRLTVLKSDNKIFKF